MASISAKKIVNVVPSVLAAGGTSFALNGMILSSNPRMQYGNLYSFSSYATTVSFFGAAAQESALAAIYFNGFTGRTKIPGTIFFARYAQVAISGFVAGANINSLATPLTLTALQALGSKTIAGLSVDGTAVSGTVTVNLAGATSMSNAATLMSAAFTPAVFTYDSISNNFVITSPTTGANSSVTMPTGALASAIGFASFAGSFISPGAAPDVPAVALNNLVSKSSDWSCYTSTFEPNLANKLAIASWNNTQGNSLLYVPWDTDTQAIVPGTTTAFGAQNILANNSGVLPVYADVNTAVFVLGWAASLDTNATNGKATLAYKSQPGIVPVVTDTTIATTLKSNGYSFYGDYSTNDNDFIGFSDGSVTGIFDWADSYVNQIWMNDSFQVDLMNLLFTVKSVPYNTDGYALIESACMNTIKNAVNFGAISSGVELSDLQIDEVNNAAGLPIDGILGTRGWYFQVQPATPATRAARTTPPCNFWYTDGGSVQAISLASVEVQ